VGSGLGDQPVSKIDAGKNGPLSVHLGAAAFCFWWWWLQMPRGFFGAKLEPEVVLTKTFVVHRFQGFSQDRDSHGLLLSGHAPRSRSDSTRFLDTYSRYYGDADLHGISDTGSGALDGTIRVDTIYCVGIHKLLG
jgi:hypothetical protein